MKKISLLFAITIILVSTASAQTLFTYGSYSADAKDFLRAYNKNNVAPASNKAKAINDYLDLYIKSRLKIQEAYDRRYDTLAMIKNEVANLRTQIAENYMTDPAFQEKLVNDAFTRSQKDIRLAHIFIAFPGSNVPVDTTAASKKKNEILDRLQKGEDFLKLAQSMSDDPNAKENKGELGYITVFTLPYEFENLIYSTPVGKYSPAIRSKIGYHIFKNLGERKALGKMKAQQILLAIPPTADENQKKAIANRADSIYKRILAGDNFNKLAPLLSNDYISANAGGLMTEISLGQYDPVFEKAIWSLTKDGAVSKPFRTSHGWHIVKRISVKPVVSDPKNKEYRDELLQKAMLDSRWQSSRDFIFKEVRSKANARRTSYLELGVWDLTDSILTRRALTEAGKTIKTNAPLFIIGETSYDFMHWLNFAATYRVKPEGYGKTYPAIREEWEKSLMVSYYRDHLESFNPDFAYQMAEFKDGNIFFEIMQQEIWNKAQMDTVALHEIYESNKGKYLWKKSADAVIFFCSDANTAKEVYDRVKADPKAWKRVAEDYVEKMVVDSSRFEWDQVPSLGSTIPKPGMVTKPLNNSADNTSSFAYIVNVYEQPSQRTFNEAKGMVIADYQALLEQQFNDKLKKKYPVKIDQAVLAEISK